MEAITQRQQLRARQSSAHQSALLPLCVQQRVRESSPQWPILAQHPEPRHILLKGLESDWRSFFFSPSFPINFHHLIAAFITGEQ